MYDLIVRGGRVLDGLGNEARLTDVAVSGDRVAAVGDLHVENFGTWRDREGRLVWGVNDFDDSETLPYAFDLARLATSATLAIEAGGVALSARKAHDAILEGYREALAEGPRSFVLAGRIQIGWVCRIKNAIGLDHRVARFDESVRRSQSENVERAEKVALPSFLAETDLARRLAVLEGWTQELQLRLSRYHQLAQVPLSRHENLAVTMFLKGISTAARAEL